MIAGLEEITGGELWIDGQLSNYVEPKDRDLSMVFQNYALYPHMSVYDNMAFSLSIRKVPKKEIDKKVHEAASILGIEHLLKQRPGELSGGQKQQAAIARALLPKPALVLADEPTGNLDTRSGQNVLGLLRMMNIQYHQTLVMITHNLDIAQTADRIIRIEDGKIVDRGM